jgi:hypothetical protein
MRLHAKFLQRPVLAATVDLQQLRSYAQQVVAGSPSLVKAVYLVGSTTVNGVGNDIDLLYDFGTLGLPKDEQGATEKLEAVIETTEINSEIYDSFYTADGRYFHLSSGAGWQIIENTEYGLSQQTKPKILLASDSS